MSKFPSSRGLNESVSIALIFLEILICAFCCIYRYNESDDTVQSENPFILNIPLADNRANIERLRASSQADFSVPTFLNETGRIIENFNLHAQETPSIIRDVTIRNPTGEQVTQMENYNIRRATTIPTEQSTSGLLASYNEIIPEDSIALQMEQHSLLPPSYNDLMQRNNERDEAT